jgi:hypothetical protein
MYIKVYFRGPSYMYRSGCCLACRPGAVGLSLAIKKIETIEKTIRASILLQK